MPYIGEFNLPPKPIGLAFAGGGVRGYAQIPVLEYMEKHGYKADIFAGTSIGSIVASLVAIGLTGEEIFNEFQAFESRFLENKTFSRPDLNMIKPTKNKINGMVDGNKITEVLDDFFGKYGVKNMADIKSPLIVVSVDSVSGKVVYFTNVKNFNPRRNAVVIYNPKLSTAVRASCSFPGVINAEKYEDMELVDGGTKMNLPVEPLKDLGAYKVMSLTMKADKSGFNTKSAVKNLKRASDLVQDELLNLQIRQSDFNINLDVGDIKAFDVGNGRLIYKRGEIIARDREEDIVNFYESVKKEREPKPEKPKKLPFWKRIFKK